MKFKTTTHEVKRQVHPDDLFYCGYCDLQYTLHFHEADAYTCGSYGWNYDVYKLDIVNPDLPLGKHVKAVICTGYRGMPGERLRAVRECEARARAISMNDNLTLEQKKIETEKILYSLLKAQYEIREQEEPKLLWTGYNKNNTPVEIYLDKDQHIVIKTKNGHRKLWNDTRYTEDGLDAVKLAMLNEGFRIE